MKTREGQNQLTWKSILPVALIVSFASSALLQEHFGLWAVGAHLLCVLGVFRLASFIASVYPNAWSRWTNLAFVLGLFALFLTIYPMEHGRGPGRSSDRDDALNLAVARIVDGESPYYPQNDRAGPLSLFPGAVLLAIPFTLAGNSAWQNLFWLPMFLALTSSGWKNPPAATVWVVAIFSVSTAIQYEFISGGDMLANSIYVPVAALLLLLAAANQERPLWGLIAASAFFGLTLTTRPNFAFVFPLVIAGVVLWRGWRMAVLSASLCIGVACLLTLPFYLNDPSGFTPFSAGNKLSLVDEVLPHASHGLIVVTVSAVCVGVWSILRARQPDHGLIWRWCAVVLLIPMIGSVLLFSASTGQADFMFMHDRYGLMPLFFALWGWIGPLQAKRLV